MSTALRCSVLLALATGSLCGCRSPGAPRQPPFITGTVVWRNATTLGVHASPGASGPRRPVDERAEVQLTSATRVLRRGGGRATREELTAGRTVSVWITPMTRDTYPVLVEATVVVLEPERRPNQSPRPAP